MTLAIKRIHNSPSYLKLRFHTIWHYIKPKHGIDELKQRLIDTWDHIPHGSVDEASGKRGCMHV